MNVGRLIGLMAVKVESVRTASQDRRHKKIVPAGVNDSEGGSGVDSATQSLIRLGFLNEAQRQALIDHQAESTRQWTAADCHS